MIQELIHSVFGPCLEFSFKQKLNLLIPQNCGWRVLSCRYEGEELFFQRETDFRENRDPNTWYLYGGHRLWHAPEDLKRTYQKDNSPPEISWDKNALKLTTQDATSVLRGVQIEFHDLEGYLCTKLLHSFTNTGLWPLELAFWTITALAQKSKGIIPLGSYKPHSQSLLPKNHIVIWSYTHLNDSRFFFHPEYVLVEQGQGDAQKIGAFSFEGFVAAEIKGKLFLKIFPVFPQKSYPDRGANAEIFTDSELLELECLSPYLKIEVGETLFFPELWVFHNRSKKSLYDDAKEVFQKVRHHIPKLLV